MARAFWVVMLVSTNLLRAQSATIVDHPIGAGVPFYLDTDAGGKWMAINSRVHVSLDATVPGDIISDLQRAGRIPDPYFNVTWRDPAIVTQWDNGNWSLETTFLTSDVRGAQDSDEVLLVFDGIKMGAMVALNSHILGTVTDQFLRFVFHIKEYLRPMALNTLMVTFSKDIDCEGRYSSVSGDGDWAPESITVDKFSGIKTFSFGVWRSVYLVPVHSVAIEHFVPHIFYAGGHPTSILFDGKHAGFDIRANVFFWAPTAVVGLLRVEGSWPSAVAVTENVHVAAGHTNLTILVPSWQTQDSRLWFPNGCGEQVRYNISISFTPSGRSTSVASTSRLIGFRHVALVTGNDTDLEFVENASSRDGNDELGMFFRVNGAVIYSRGGNKIPMEEMEGRLSPSAHRRLVQSAAEAHFNTLRVWGGGLFEIESFYDACDEFGILLHHDMQTSGIPPSYITPATMERQEIQYQIRRLSHHPSIVLWNGCNECAQPQGPALYEHFVMPTVAGEDQSRPIWPASPSAGWISGVDRLSSRPNGNKLVARPFDTVDPQPSPQRPINYPFLQDGHGPYAGLNQSSWPSINGAAWPTFLVDASIMPSNGTPTVGGGHLGRFPGIASAVPALTGPGYVSWYRSEFGAVAWSSFESISAQLPPNQWSLHSAAAHYRNWPVDNVIKSFFGLAQNLNLTGRLAFKRQLYQSMLGQALFLKTEIEGWRSQNVFGTTMWMYNEVWPTGGWGSIEYGGSSLGQVEGGRWKPLQYFLKASTFADQLSTCNTAGACFIRNDAPHPFAGEVLVTLLNILTSKTATLTHQPVTLAAGAGVTTWFCAAHHRRSAHHKAQVNQKTLPQRYTKYIGQIPTNDIALAKLMRGNISECEIACDAIKACVGFTHVTSVSDVCWLYYSSPELVSDSGAEWYHKPGSSPIPGPPSPSPYPQLLPQLSCTVWSAMPEYTGIGCEASGANCLVTVEVTTSTGKRASFNVLPFHPPKSIKLPKANVTATVGEAISANGEPVHVPISLFTTATALYVTLTTSVAGRFSDNAILLLTGRPLLTITFYPWGRFGEKEHAILKASLRVEHLQENLGGALTEHMSEWQV